MPKQRTAEDREQHLYIVLDVWHSGYSIRKVSWSRSRRSGKHFSSSGEGADPLPGAFMRIRAPRGFPGYIAAAFGTKIMVMNPVIAYDIPGIPGIPMIDVEELSFDYGPVPRYHASPIYLPVGNNKLFALGSTTFHCYLRMPKHSEPWQLKNLPLPPFKREDVSSYAVQPDGCIFVSTKTGTTVIFDTKEYVWNRYSNFVLPFTGRGYYDTSQEGFVGLSKHPETFGYLYCSTMASTQIGDTFKCSKVKVFNKDPDKHVSATLLHMRPGKFCLVECVSIDNGRADQELREQSEPESEPESAGGVPQRCCFMYRLKAFSLVYDAKRDLKLKNSRGRCYMLPQNTTSYLQQDPVAFWL